MQFVDQNDILRATDGGLDIILALYPEALKSVELPNRKFKLRVDERTASASLKKKFDSEKGFDVWLVTDFGGDQTPRNGIGCYAEENGITFVQALQQLGEKYRVTGGQGQVEEAAKPEYSDRPAREDEEEGKWTYELKKEFSNTEIELLFSKHVLASIGWNSPSEDKRKSAYAKIRGICQRYKFHAVESYTIIKNRKAMTFASTDTYPIFIFIEEKFEKYYQPKHHDKGRRFMYYGSRPKDFLHGLEQAKKEYERREKATLEDDVTYDEADAEEQAQKRKVEKLEEVILASGGSDALNMAVLDYWPVWPNSETAGITEWQWKDLCKVAKKVYQLQDIDATGKRVAHQLAMQYLDLYTIELPEALNRRYDAKLNPCKDFRDYMNHYKVYDFRDLVKISIPYRFWDLKPQFAGRGENKTFAGYTYEFNNVQAYNFLAKNGFYRMRSDSKKCGYIYVQIDGNIVREVEANDIKNFIHQFLQERMLDNDLRNVMYKTTQLSEGSLSNLRFTEIDFSDHDKHRQFVFFQNGTWEVTGKEIRVHKPGQVDRYVWEEDVIDRRVKPLQTPFSITHQEDDDTYDITVNSHDCLFLNYLIQTSRIHWRKELETELFKLPPAERDAYLKENKFNIEGPLISEDERREQKLHLINKIFSIGYLLHRYKDPSRPWCIFAMDNNINDDGGSYGGSGKSILFGKAITQVLKKHFYLGGRNPKITDNPHIYDGLTEHHRYVYIDDADEYLNFKFFFDAITGELKVNPKNVQPFSIPFEKVGKFAITSNFTLRNIDPSTERRILYTVFSDYFHQAGETSDYAESRSPKDDFGKNLFMEFTDDEWARFYNTMIYCLQFYLSVQAKINPPMDNVTRRNLLTAMGHNFEAWAAVYFSEEAGNLDRLVVKKEAFDDFLLHNKLGWASQRFTKALKAFCNYHHFTLNPKELHNSEKRIVHRVSERRQNRDGSWEETGKEKTAEMIYIQTKPELNIEPVKTLPF